MSVGDMDRRMAVRGFNVRIEEIRAKIRDLPLAEKFRVAADFLESGQSQFALVAARLAVTELETLSSLACTTGGDRLLEGTDR